MTKAIHIDEQVYKSTFESLYEPLCFYANSFLRDADEAEELVQSAFVKFWEKRESLDIETSFKSYLYATVRNASLNWLKHQKVRQVHVQEAKHTLSEATQTVADEAEYEELNQKVKAVIDKLPEQCRKIFIRCKMDGKKYREIAEEFDISPKTVENQMGKALRIMRENLSEYLPIAALILAQSFFASGVGVFYNLIVLALIIH